MDGVASDRGRDLVAADEPAPAGEDWMDCFGELMFVAGFTEGGAPYGLTADEFRRANAAGSRGAGWLRAKHVLQDLFERRGGPDADVEVGWVKKVGDGLSREVFAADVELNPDPGNDSGPYVAMLPRLDADPEVDVRTLRELRLLGRLERMALPFRVPHVIGAYPEGRRPVLVRRFLRGIELDLRAGRQPGVRPWETIAEIAAAVHALEAAHFRDLLPSYDNRRDHAESALRVLDGLEGSMIGEARAWAAERLPPDEPNVLLHGDLLGQNILLDPGAAPAVIDWEYARLGDPAYDLAIVTRGVKQPFQLDRGLDRLLDAYHRHGGSASITKDHVRLHELCLLAHFYRDALAGQRGCAPQAELDRLRAFVRRL